MLTPHQQDLVRRSFFAVSLLDSAGDDRFDVKKAKYILQKVVTTDFVKSSDILEFEPEQIERQHYVIQQISGYYAQNLWKRALSWISPLALGLTPTECQFALDEIVGHPRWNE